MNTNVVAQNFMPDWLFIPAYPFEIPKSLTGYPPFTVADYINTPPLQLKALAQLALIFIVFKAVS